MRLSPRPCCPESIAADSTKAEGSDTRPRPNTRSGKPKSTQKPESVRTAKNVPNPSNAEFSPPSRQTKKRLEVEASRCPRGTGTALLRQNLRIRTTCSNQSPKMMYEPQRSTGVSPPKALTRTVLDA
jgi:hypothetical protein